MTPESRIHKLRQLAEGLHRGHSYSLTRLSVLKPLCQDREAALAFASFAIELALDASIWDSATTVQQRRLIRSVRAYARLASSRRTPVRGGRALLDVLVAAQPERRRVPFGIARVINSRHLLISEIALRLALAATPDERAATGYALASSISRRYDPRYGTGLIPSSAELVDRIVAFWQRYHGA